ncbi:hypothetical protein [Nocardioides sp. SYSU D00065]|uniref:hypothetical protein n=1 Tax=Nocardioides sp. SYSU D00065 TaxID=2817378 RepID=UPI001FEE17FE|nr:hypothetical protein [Nocardioides sp. SYSU D00065]
MTRRARWAALAGAGCALVLAGCAGAQDDAALSAARQLLAAARDSDGTAACALLAPATRSELEQTSGRPCERAILEEDLGQGGDPEEGAEEGRVEVFDSMAQAVVGRDRVFLSRFDGRWLVVAAACTPVADRPYDCSIAMP